MRFMAIVKATEASEKGVMPSERLLEAMAAYNETLVKAGIMVDGAGLQPSSRGVRVTFTGDRTSVINGPFPESKELIAGFWILEAGSLEEAIDVIRRSPNPADTGVGEIEIRPFFGLEDFGESEAIAHHRKVADDLSKRG